MTPKARLTREGWDPLLADVCTPLGVLVGDVSCLDVPGVCAVNSSRHLLVLVNVPNNLLSRRLLVLLGSDCKSVGAGDLSPTVQAPALELCRSGRKGEGSALDRLHAVGSPLGRNIGLPFGKENVVVVWNDNAQRGDRAKPTKEPQARVEEITGRGLDLAHLTWRSVVGDF